MKQMLYKSTHIIGAEFIIYKDILHPKGRCSQIYIHSAPLIFSYQNTTFYVKMS